MSIQCSGHITVDTMSKFTYLNSVYIQIFSIGAKRWHMSLCLWFVQLYRCCYIAAMKGKLKFWLIEFPHRVDTVWYTNSTHSTIFFRHSKGNCLKRVKTWKFREQNSVQFFFNFVSDTTYGAFSWNRYDRILHMTLFIVLFSSTVWTSFWTNSSGQIGRKIWIYMFQMTFYRLERFSNLSFGSNISILPKEFFFFFASR